MKKFLSVLTSLSICICFANALTANAVSHEIASVENGDIEIAVDKITISETELKAKSYQVPVFVKFTKNAGITEAEFGIRADASLQYKVITSSSQSIAYADSGNIQDAILNFEMVHNTTRDLTWCAWASDSVNDRTGNILLLVVEIPHDENGLSGGEIRDNYRYYDIAYAETGNNLSTQLYKNSSAFPNVINYSNSVNYSDGWVRIPLIDTPAVTVKGDADGSGELDILDIITVNKTILGKETLPEERIPTVDLNQNGVPDSGDALIMLKMIVGLI